METENVKPFLDLSQLTRSKDEVLVGWLLSQSLISVSPWRPCSTKHGQLIASGVNFHHAPRRGKWLSSAFCHTSSLKLGKRTICTQYQPNGSNFSNSHFYPKPSLHRKTEAICQAEVQRRKTWKRANTMSSLTYSYFPHSLPSPWKHMYTTTLLPSPSIKNRGPSDFWKKKTHFTKVAKL